MTSDDGVATRLPAPDAPAVVFARLRLGTPLPGGRRAGESGRAVHLVPLLPCTGVPQLLLAFYGQPIRPGMAEVADQLAGMPCTTCLLRDPR